MDQQPILAEHTALLNFIAKAEASKSRMHGYIDSGPTKGWVEIGVRILQAMNTSNDAAVISYAERLIKSGLIEAYNESNHVTVRMTNAGKSYLAGGVARIVRQEHPPLNLSGLHPKVQEVASQLTRDGHYRQAIHETFIALIGEVKKVSGVTDVDGSKLMQRVFSQNNPTIKIGDGDDQLGHMWLFSGAVMGFRNVFSHTSKQENDPQRTLEILSFASYLFRVLEGKK